ncbi:MAG: lysostaphin resistance A-like protein, partial [Anaerolineae bacterium]
MTGGIEILLIAALGALGLLLTLAYVAEREEALKWFVYFIVGMVDLAMIPLGVLMSLTPRLAGLDATTGASVSEALDASGLSGDAGLVLMGDMGWVLIAMGVAGLVLLLPPVRRLIALALPIDPDRVVHAVALQYVVLLIGVSAMNGLTMEMLVGDEESLDQLSSMASETGLATLWAQSFGFALLALLGVGIIVQRDVKETLSRLGLTRGFSVKWWIAATGLALISSYAIDSLWAWLSSEDLAQVERLSEALFEPYLSAGLLGALTIGVSAGIGEEILFRGAAQPRLGLIFTSLLFGVLHTQYTVSLALVQVFIVGLLLGLCRQRTSTTTAIGVHATYNFVLASFA